MKFQNIFSNKKEKIINSHIIQIDKREKNSLVVSELINLKQKIKFIQLPIADYIINNIAVERKTVSDFKSSIINKRLINQLKELKQFPIHYLIIEGILENDLYSGSIHQNAIRGLILSILNDYQIPIIFTYNELDTAKFLMLLAKIKIKKESPIRPKKTNLSNNEKLQFILEGFPKIGPINAKKLLINFKSIKNISNSSKNKLNNIIGHRSDSLHSLINKNYIEEV